MTGFKQIGLLWFQRYALSVLGGCTGTSNLCTRIVEISYLEKMILSRTCCLENFVVLYSFVSLSQQSILSSLNACEDFADVDGNLVQPRFEWHKLEIGDLEGS